MIKKIIRRLRAYKIRVLSIPSRLFLFFASNNSYIGKANFHQPMHLMGEGKIYFENIDIGVSCSPYFFNYSYIEARDTNSEVRVGRDTWINNSCKIIAYKANISIGNKCLIGSNFECINSDFHGINPTERNELGSVVSKNIFIGDNVFIGNNVTVLKGVVIGNNSVVANSSVVVKDVPENVIVAGNPAKIIKEL